MTDLTTLTDGALAAHLLQVGAEVERRRVFAETPARLESVLTAASHAGVSDEQMDAAVTTARDRARAAREAARDRIDEIRAGRGRA